MKENLNDLRAFLVVARVGSFTKAAQLLGVSQSALSHCIRGIEDRLHIKLLQRTTRSIATTGAGERLYQKLSPLFDVIDDELNALSAMRDTVRGRLRINGTEHAIAQLWPKFARFLRDYPGVELELVGESRFADIVAERFDAGIRLGDDLERDMIAVRVSPDMRMCVVASPAYLAAHGTPQTPSALAAHRCINLILSSGEPLVWEFLDPHSGKVVKIRTTGRFAANRAVLVEATLADFGLLWTPRDVVQARLADGTLVEVLADWAISYTGYHLYYPHRRADAPLFRALVGFCGKIRRTDDGAAFRGFLPPGGTDSG